MPNFSYRQIHVQIWKDNWFLDMEPNTKLLFIYLITNERARLSGLYELSDRVIMFETCLSKEEYNHSKHELIKHNKVLFDDGWVWVVNMRKWHDTGSDKLVIHFNNDLKDTPDMPLRQQYIEYYRLNIPYVDGMHTPSIPPVNLTEPNLTKSNQKVTKFIDAAQAERVYQEVTGQVTFPGTKRDLAIDAICKLYPVHQDKTVDYLAYFYESWIERKTDSGKRYSRTNMTWLTDWAVSGEVPVQSDNARPAKADDWVARAKADLEAKQHGN